MSDNINILILSCGVRNKIVQYFKSALNGRGKVIATDCSKYAPALYDADKYYIVPEITSDNYLDEIFSICKTNNVKAVLSLIDPELSLLSKHLHKFRDIGVEPIVSSYEIVELCLDKYAMNRFLAKHNFDTIKSYVDKKQFYEDVEKKKISYPVFVKPRDGSASININKAYSREEVELLFSREANLIIQEHMDGKEYGVDAYIDLISSQPITIFLKEKIKMRAGETDKSISIKDNKLFDLIERFIKLVGFRGTIDIEEYKKNNRYYISEVNPRFGGGYPHAYGCGVNIPQMIVNNIDGISNDSIIGEYDDNVCMMKYSEIKFETMK